MASSLTQSYLRWTAKLSNATEYLAVAIFAGIVLVNFMAVGARYVLADPIGWSEEALRYAIVWAVYLVAGATFRHGEQMMIDLIVIIPSDMIKRIAALLSLLTTLVLAAIVVALGIPFLMDTGQVSPSMRLPMWIPYASVVIGYLMIAVQAIAGYIEQPVLGNKEPAK
nr:TRAP transporter small permease subunit [uncultured Cohaesibacter sp.]